VTRSAALAVALLLGGASVARAEDAAWKRGDLVPLDSESCRELHVDRSGAGLLEIRFVAEPVPVPVGPDPKTSGASLLIPADDPERASFLLYDASGIYAQSARLAPPIRWMRRGRDLCVASGTTPVFCGRTRHEVEGTTRIAFGAGWETKLSGCAPIPLRERPTAIWLVLLAVLVTVVALRSARGRSQRLAIALLALVFGAAVIAAQDPWRLPPSAIVGGAAVALGWAGVAAARGRGWRDRTQGIGLALLVAIALARVPHPVWTATPAPSLAPPLWLDPASWQPLAPHQSLAFRDRPVASLAREAPNWLVLGGSVVFGDGVEAHQAFPAVAQDLLRGTGSRIEVFNAGVQGWNVHNVDRFLADVGDALPVTGIAIASILNNATLPIAAPDVADCGASLLHAAFCNVSRNQLLFTWPKVFLPKPHNPERYRDALRRILVREIGRGRKVVLLDEIGEIDAGLKLWDTESYREIARSVGAELGVPFHSVSDAVASLPPAERWLDGIHPTPAMHALLGKRLAEILREP